MIINQTIDKVANQDREEGRINALKRYKIAGTLPEPIFDHYVQMATLIFRVPAAVIAFVGEDFVHYKASIGVGGIESEKRYGLICADTIEATDDVYVVNLGDSEHHLPGQPNSAYTFYAGTPIVTPDGYAIGCLSLFDHKYNLFVAEQQAILKILASGIMEAVEERLANLQERERKQWLSKTTQEGLWEWDITKDQIWWDYGFSMLFGYPQVNETHYGLNFWCSRFADDTAADVKASMRAFALDGEYLFKKIDDTLAHVLIRSATIKDEFGQPTKVIGSILNISERFSNEEMNRKAQIEQMRQKDEFISIASHEIKTPITIIKSYSQIIKKETRKEIYHNSALSIYAERIQKQSDKLLKLVENLLDISRISIGKMTVYPEVFDLVKLLDQTIEELDVGTFSHRIETVGDSPLLVYADKFRIGQVLTNLISNAIKYSPGADRVIISYFKNLQNNTATVSIKDFGKGIAKADQVKLFQKFHRIVDLNKNKISGTGLGLNIAMEIMKEHGSIINLSSEPGKGSVFSFDLPLSASLTRPW